MNQTTDPTSSILPIMDWAQFGLAGLVIAALFAVLVFMYRSHQSERSEWRKEAQEMHAEQTSAIKSLDKVTTELMIAVRELIYKVKP
jgi:hypothetical protein